MVTLEKKLSDLALHFYSLLISKLAIWYFLCLITIKRCDLLTFDQLHFDSNFQIWKVQFWLFLQFRLFIKKWQNWRLKWLDIFIMQKQHLIRYQSKYSLVLIEKQSAATWTVCVKSKSQSSQPKIIISIKSKTLKANQWLAQAFN